MNGWPQSTTKPALIWAALQQVAALGAWLACSGAILAKKLSFGIHGVDACAFLPRSNRFSFAILMALISTSARADYFAVGPIEGNVCWGFGIEVCALHEISAVRGDDDRLYEVKRQFTSVTEYKENSSRCWITTKSKGGGLISWGINAIKQPIFLERTSSSKYKELDVEYLTFKCVRR